MENTLFSENNKHKINANFYDLPREAIKQKRMSLFI
jgi:hypothetical protein